MDDIRAPESDSRWARMALAARVIVGAVLVLGLLLAARLYARDYLAPREALALVRSVQDEPWALLAYLGAYLIFTSALVPAAMFHMVAGAAWGFPAGLALNVLSCNAVACLQFVVARKLGRARVARMLARGPLAAFDAAAAEGGLRASISIRALPLPFLAVNTAGGVSGVRLRDFALGTFIGTIPVISIYTYFSASLVEGVAGAEQKALVQLVISGALLIAASYGPRLWARWRKTPVPSGRGP